VSILDRIIPKRRKTRIAKIIRALTEKSGETYLLFGGRSYSYDEVNGIYQKVYDGKPFTDTEAEIAAMRPILSYSRYGDAYSQVGRTGGYWSGELRNLLCKLRDQRDAAQGTKLKRAKEFLAGLAALRKKK
jgi:hypothetical protein